MMIRLALCVTNIWQNSPTGTLQDVPSDLLENKNIAKEPEMSDDE